MGLPILRPYQIDAVTKNHKQINKNLNAVTILGTGGGKSVIIAQFVLDLMLQGKKILIQVHRKELVSQLSLALAKFEITHNIIAPTNVVKQIVGQQRAEFKKQFYDFKSKVIVGSVDTLISRASKYGPTLQNIDVVITDEAAHVLKENKWGRCIALFPNARLVGFTATPLRLDKKGLGSHVDGVFDVMIEGPKVRWLIEQGFLSKYKIVAPPSDFERNLGFVKSSTSDFSNTVIKDAAEKSQIVGDVVENYLKFAAGTQAIVFAPTLIIGKEMEEKFNLRGIPATFLSSLSTDKERFDGVNKFKENEIQVLLNVDLFDEGFDIKIAEGKKIIETVILARPTMSLGKYLQQIGRGLRPSPNKKHAIIIDHVGNVKRHGLPCNERKWTLDRILKRKTVDGMVRICGECASAYERVLTACPYCGAAAMSATRDSAGRTPPEQVDGDLELMDPETIRELNESTMLEDPASIAQRVGAVAGIVAGKSAAKKQLERIKTQDVLKDKIADWAGRKKSSGLSDREIHKEFYINFGKTVSGALGEPNLQMTMLIEELG